MIIGLSGYARSGKDTAANGLGIFGFRRVAFADKLREFLLRLDPIVGIDEDTDYWRVSDVVHVYGWNGYKTSPYGNEMRELMQRLGTECGRQLISDTVWIDAALGTGIVEPERLVVTDVRFPNEAEAIKARGGFVVRINRPGVGPANAHPSETALDDWTFDAIIDNDESEGALHHKLHDLAFAFIR